LEQVPSVVGPGSAHDLHVPVQLLPQQTPCSQNPEAHSLAAPQATPTPLSVHAVPLQLAGETHSLGVAPGAQLVLQLVLVASQTKKPGQALLVAARQMPAPSQVRAEVSVEPLHDPATHWVPV
jgi:hypothetical protein